MDILGVIITIIISLIVGIVIGFIIGVVVVKSLIEKKLSNEDMIRSIFQSMGYKPNESQIRNIIKNLKKN